MQLKSGSSGYVPGCAFIATCFDWSRSSQLTNGFYVRHSATGKKPTNQVVLTLHSCVHKGFSWRNFGSSDL